MKHQILLFTLLIPINILGQCSDIKVKNDKFTNKTICYSPLNYTVQFTKVIDDTVTVISMTISTQERSYNIGKSGVIILLENGEKIVKDVEIKVGNSVAQYCRYSATFLLNESDLVLLMNNRITDFRIYIYDTSLNERAGDWFIPNYAIAKRISLNC